tara:strand:+ start:844 stop:1320 length:477 start_codon:yes stop_codon:yes gene_type:complete
MLERVCVLIFVILIGVACDLEEKKCQFESENSMKEVIEGKGIVNEELYVTDATIVGDSLFLSSIDDGWGYTAISALLTNMDYARVKIKSDVIDTIILAKIDRYTVCGLKDDRISGEIYLENETLRYNVRFSVDRQLPLNMEVINRCRPSNYSNDLLKR